MPLKKYTLLCLLTLLLSLGGTACNQPVPNETPTPRHVGCSVPELIQAIQDANQSPEPSEIFLGECVYTLTRPDNSRQIEGLTVHSGLPVISSEIIIRGNNSVIEITKDTGEPFFGHFFVDPSGDLELYDLVLRGGTRALGGAVINRAGDFFASNVLFWGNSVYPFGGERRGNLQLIRPGPFGKRLPFPRKHRRRNHGQWH